MLLLGISVVSLAYTLSAAWLVGGLRATAAPVLRSASGVTLLKPLHGAEPRLADNLRSFAEQDYPAPIQLLCGTADPSDPAAATAVEIGGQLVSGGRRIGSNGKISNLAMMMRHARHDIVVLSDSDMAVARDYLATVVATLQQPGVGAVTCLYRGRGDAGGWSRLAAGGLSYQFLPSVVIGLALGLAKPCMGSTIALRRETLAAIGGFERFADILADDYAIGAAVRQLGFEVAVPPLVLTHGCADASLPALLRHELRWAATVRGIDPGGYAGSALTHTLPLALVTGAVIGGLAWALVVAAVAARWLLMWRVDRIVGEASTPWWQLPARDLLSAVVWVGGLFVRRLQWRGERLGVAADGTMALDGRSA